MARTQAYLDAKARYQKTKRKLISADVPKETGEIYQAYVKAIGGSMSGLIRRAVDEFIANHAPQNSTVDNSTEHGQALTNDEKHLVDTFNKLSPEAQKALLKFLDALQR